MFYMYRGRSPLQRRMQAKHFKHEYTLILICGIFCYRCTRAHAHTHTAERERERERAAAAALVLVVVPVVVLVALVVVTAVYTVSLFDKGIRSVDCCSSWLLVVAVAEHTLLLFTVILATNYLKLNHWQETCYWGYICAAPSVSKPVTVSSFVFWI